MELKPVDEDITPASEVVRLRNTEITGTPKIDAPVRFKPLHDEPVASRLEVPGRDEVVLRTHQPDIDVLMDAEAENRDATEEAWGNVSVRRHPIPWGWFALIGLVIAGAVAWSLSHVEKSAVQANQIRGETESLLEKEIRDEKEARQLVDRLEACLRSFFSATSLESLARHVRQAERVKPLMEKYYADHPVSQGAVRDIKALRPVTIDDRTNFWMASVALADGQKRNLIIEVGPDGVPLIDWETLVCYQPMQWDRFATERPESRSLDFRVYAEPDAFYSHEFADSNRWQSFRLTALDSDETLFGYVAKNSPEAEIMMDVIRKNGGLKTSLILRLGIPAGLKSRRGVVIEKVLNPRWLYLDPPPASF